ncbi:hypothetical protein [Eubacterium oxidoreducens]|uniref:Uncharacterized protein n=1 Tax=Eubacterium oxidoreducens TaxID=1732 RepID=A0A1G6A4E5_EUBOX|nr:hypothetical protein [Eubacterium oxidoreducens]SDB03126.1 hypothetical protein SAMN02910417_00233 [Eubacterium oxidoreducens]
MEKMNFTNKQTAFEYAFYMIAASYFNKAICRSKMTEQNMLIQYKEQKVKTRSRVLRAGFGSASADKFLSESVRILAERLTQSELVPRLS